MITRSCQSQLMEAVNGLSFPKNVVHRSIQKSILRSMQSRYRQQCTRKAALKVSPRSFASLRNYLNESGEKFGVLISAAPFSEHREGNTRLVNLPLYLCEGETILGLV